MTESESAPARDRSRRVAAAALALLLAAGVAVVLADLAVRAALAAGVPLDRTLLRIGGTECRLAFDPVLGWKNVARSVDTCHGETVATNALGMRGPEVASPKPPGTVRVLALGDSFTWGWGAAQRDTYPAQLEELLRARLRGGAGAPHVEVVNGGVSGYGTVQELLWLDRLGPALAPDVVVLFYYRNDFFNNLLGFEYGYPRPDYADVLGPGGAPRDLAATPGVPRMLQHKGVYYAVAPRGVWAHSAIVRVLVARAQASAVLARRLEQLGIVRVDTLGADPPRSRQPTGIDASAVSVALVKRVVERAAALGARTLVVVSPSTYGLTEAGYAQGVDPEWLPAPLARAGVDVIDVFPVLRDRKLLHDQLCLSPRGEHFNRFGNGVIAELVADALIERGWLRARRPEP